MKFYQQLKGINEMESINVKSTLEEMIFLMKNIGEHMEELNLQQSMADKEIIDLEHESELSTLNACEMSKSWMLLRDSLRKRRIAKDELRTLGHFRKFVNENNDLLSTMIILYNTMQQVEIGNKARQYRPRIMTNLKICKSVCK
jgi:hypothetical protein